VCGGVATRERALFGTGHPDQQIDLSLDHKNLQNRSTGPATISPCETSLALKRTLQPPPQMKDVTSGSTTSGNHSPCILKPRWRVKKTFTPPPSPKEKRVKRLFAPPATRVAPALPITNGRAQRGPSRMYSCVKSPWNWSSTTFSLEDRTSSTWTCVSCLAQRNSITSSSSTRTPTATP
jgi:hypothetical protein